MESKNYIDLREVKKEYTSNQLKHIMDKKGDKEQKEVFAALDNITIRIDEGEKVGVIGLNGAGKSTLMQIISGYSKESEGIVEVCGRVNAILEVGTNLSKELTGRENIYLAGEMYGLSKEQIEEMMPKIIEFVDIGLYFDYPVKTYSSGMMARVAFAQISFIEPEILIIDEVLGVGDISFVEKSTKLIQDLCKKGKILLVVSHSMATINQMTDRCIWLNHGKIIMDDKTKIVTDSYIKYVRKLQAEEYAKEAEKRLGDLQQYKDIIFKQFLLKCKDVEQDIFESKDDISIFAVLQSKRNLRNVDVILKIENKLGVVYMINKMSEESGSITSFEKNQTMEISIKLPNCNFTEDTYHIYCYVLEMEKVIGQISSSFKILDNKREYYQKPLILVDSYWDMQYKGEKLKNEHYWDNTF